MKPIVLSSNLLAEKLLILLSIIFDIFLWSLHIIPIIFLLLILIFIVYGLYTMFFVVKHIKYDDGGCVIINKLNEKNVSFNNITKIQITPYYGSWRTMWRMVYLEKDKEESVLFYAKYGLISLDKFITTIKDVNPELIVKLYTTTLEVD